MSTNLLFQTKKKAFAPHCHLFSGDPIPCPSGKALGTSRVGCPYITSPYTPILLYFHSLILFMPRASITVLVE